MLRFFRHIRKSLMEKDQIRRYIWYALGEIFLVVLGILIAIQVSNWNEKRILQESAAYHLSLLSQDLDEDKDLLSELIQVFEQRELSIERLLDVFKGIESMTHQLPEDMISLQLEYNFKPRNSGLNVLVNTGEIGALQVTYQNLISKYYRSVDAIQERDNITNSYIQTKLEPHIFEHYSYLYGIGNTFPMLYDIYQDDTREPIVFDTEQFLSDKKLEALLVARLYQNRRLLEVYQQALENLNELQSYIEN